MLKKTALVFALFFLTFNFSVKAQTLKGDPWIFQVYKEVYHRQPSAWELNINNYNGGSWNNYGELRKYVQEYQASISRNGLTIVTKKIDDNKVLTGFIKEGKLLAANIVSPQGGNVVAAGGGNVVAAGGGNVVAAGGLNLQITSNTAGVGFGGKYTVQSAGTTVIPSSGKGALIIK
jgi:hypothetical protein